jgi:hypothetical protein
MRIKNEEHNCQADEIDYMVTLKPTRKRKRINGHIASKIIIDEAANFTEKQWKVIDKVIKSFGGCLKCYGKGYSTEMIGKTIARAYFIGQKDKVLSKGGVKIHLCSCNRGNQLEDILNRKK